MFLLVPAHLVSLRQRAINSCRCSHLLKNNSADDTTNAVSTMFMCIINLVDSLTGNVTCSANIGF